MQNRVTDALVQLLKRSSGSALLAAVVIVMPISAVACGLSWDEPKSHFEGVSFQGYVFLVETFGEVELRDGGKLPIRAIFRSESNSTSLYFGRGWELPILESHIVQMDERWFRVVEPTGWYRLFWRDVKDPTVLHGQGNWKGVIRGNSISVMADCGDRLDFRDGKITAMYLKGQRLDVERSPGGAALKESSSTLLTVQRSQSGEEIDLKIGNSKTVKVGYGNRPIIEVIAGQPVVRQQVKSLGTIMSENAEKRVWEYALDEMLNPTLIIGDRKIAWNPTTRHIISDTDWEYEIKSGEDPKDYAAIKRKNPKKQTEFWHRDAARGEEVIQTLSGSKLVRTWYTAGNLRGKVRSEDYGGQKISYSYNENGQVIQRSIGEERILYKYDEHGTLLEEITNSGRQVARYTNFYIEGLPPSLVKKIVKERHVFQGEEIAKRLYFDKYQKLIAELDAGSNLKEYLFDGEGREIGRLHNGIQSVVFSYHENNPKPSTKTEYGMDGTSITRRYKFIYNSDGQLSAERIECDETGTINEIQYYYDTEGKLAKINSSLTGEYLIGRQ